MLKRCVLILSLTLSFLLSMSVFASTPLSCYEITQTRWVDDSEAGFGSITLMIGFFFNSYLSYYTDGLSSNEEGSVGCDVQSDGSLLITLPQVGNAGTLVLKTSDLQTLTVLPPSSLENADRRPVAIHGPFLRV